ncbi:MAG: hypothetical protein JWN12_352 [Candidatus Saccharibacteria bacterium]|nr:hypothetical protein [Candidatus Saccharibacteria bacterium]
MEILLSILIYGFLYMVVGVICYFVLRLGGEWYRGVLDFDPVSGVLEKIEETEARRTRIILRLTAVVVAPVVSVIAFCVGLPLAAIKACYVGLRFIWRFIVT